MSEDREQSGLMLLEERVSKLENRSTVVDEELVMGADILRSVIERVKALEELTRRQDLELCKQSPLYFTAHYAKVKEGPDRVPGTPGGDTLAHTVDPQEPVWNKRFIGFDISTSPKNIPFSVALEYMKAGRRVRHSTWQSDYLFLSKKNETGYHYIAKATPNIDGEGLSSMWKMDASFILAPDWEVVPEP